MGRQNTVWAPFKRLVHSLADELPDDATWHDLAARVRQEIELAELVRNCERHFGIDADSSCAGEE